MKTRPKRKRVRSEKSQKEAEPEKLETVKKVTPVRGEKEVNNVVVTDSKIHGKKVNDKAVAIKSNSSKTRGKTGGPKKIGNNVKQKVDDDDTGMVDADFLDSENQNDEEEEGEENDDEYQLEDEKEEDFEISDSGSSTIGYEKPYYGGRKKLPPRSAATQKIDYSDNRYYHEFQEYFHARLDDDEEPKRRKSFSTPTKKRSSKRLYSDDDDYSDNMSSSSQDLRRSKKPRKKKLPRRESKEKNIDYSENKYYRQFDSAFNSKLWTDKLLDDDDDEDEYVTIDSNNNDDEQGTNKKHSGGNKKSVTSTPASTPRKTPASTPQKIPKNRSTRSVRSADSKISGRGTQSYLNEDEQVFNQENDDY